MKFIKGSVCLWDIIWDPAKNTRGKINNCLICALVVDRKEDYDEIRVRDMFGATFCNMFKFHNKKIERGTII